MKNVSFYSFENDIRCYCFHNGLKDSKTDETKQVDLSKN